MYTELLLAKNHALAAKKISIEDSFWYVLPYTLNKPQEK